MNIYLPSKRWHWKTGPLSSDAGLADGSIEISAVRSNTWQTLDTHVDGSRLVARIDAAYRAKTHDELAPLTGDLPARGGIWAALRERLSHPAPVALCPPDMDDGDRRVLGRNASCDYAIADRCVSARHAELIRVRDGWMIKDLGSRNGTRVNGWLVSEQRLRAGDCVTLGTTDLLFQPRD